MRLLIASCIAASLLGTVGCGTKAEVKEQKTVTTPSGETTTTETKTVEKSGDAPPPADTTTTPNP